MHYQESLVVSYIINEFLHFSRSLLLSEKFVTLWIVVSIMCCAEQNNVGDESVVRFSRENLPHPVIGVHACA